MCTALLGGALLIVLTPYLSVSTPPRPSFWRKRPPPAAPSPNQRSLRGSPDQLNGTVNPQARLEERLPKQPASGVPTARAIRCCFEHTHSRRTVLGCRIVATGHHRPPKVYKSILGPCGQFNTRSSTLQQQNLPQQRPTARWSRPLLEPCA